VSPHECCAIDDASQFEADMDYLRGLSNAIFEQGSRDDLIAIAQRDALT
jgi:hypothetical protein